MNLKPIFKFIAVTVLGGTGSFCFWLFSTAPSIAHVIFAIPITGAILFIDAFLLGLIASMCESAEWMWK